MALDPTIVSTVKDRAEGLFSKGKCGEALSAYEKIQDYGQKDPRIYLRMGDISRKTDDVAAAIGYYKKASEAFIRLGFTIKAIAVCKMIINIDPGQRDVQARLARLHGEHSPSPAPEKKEKRSVPRTPIFSEFTEDEFLEVVKKLKSRELGKGEYLFHEGDPGDSIFIVADGEVDVIGRARDSAKVKLATLAEGSIFGEFGFFLDSTRTTDVAAAVPSTILELAKADLKEIISKSGRVEEILFKFYKERVVDRFMALSELFKFISPAHRKEILSRLTLAAHPEGAVIVREGDRGETMYLIKEGTVSVRVNDSNGVEKEVARLGPGDFFGEIALATNRPRVATVAALTGVKLVEFSRPVIKDIIGKYPQIKDALERVIKERVVDVLRVREEADLLI